ncbi:MAG TPA: hypothetical protein VNO30_00785 [Kofleriaceae bacterium]|nr:hypothetical protein [Kofleriaceae bacterium]
MRTAAVILALLGACDKKSTPQAPPAGSGGSAGSGSGSGSASSALVADAAVVAAAMPDAPAPDAAVAAAAAAAITITADGLSSMRSYKRTGKTEDEVIADIQTKLAAVPGLKVGFDVMEYADEREEGYFSVKQGEAEVAQLFRTENDGVDVRVTGAMFPTTDGVRTGDKVGALAAKYPDLVCDAHEDSELGLLQCRSKQAAGLVFVLDAETYKGKKRGKLDVAKLRDRPIYMIAAGVGG